jgi:hypothetical protein
MEDVAFGDFALRAFFILLFIYMRLDERLTQLIV